MTITAVLGGTFDPVHIGHVLSAQALLARLGDARLFLVPCQIPAHRPEPAASPEDRLAMLKLALRDCDNILADDCELKRSGTSYTFDTLQDFRQRLGESSPLVFVMGIDAWVTLPTWHRWQALTSLASILVLDRPGAQRDEPLALQQWSMGKLVTELDELTQSPAGRILHLELPPVDVSASGLRASLASGGGEAAQCADQLDEKVLEYILCNKLYVSGSTAHGS